MQITDRRFADAAILEVRGALTGPAAGELLQIAVRGQLLADARIVVVSLSDVRQIDDHGLSALAAARGAVHQTGREFRLVAPAALLTRLGVLDYLGQGLPVFGTVADALADLRRVLEHRRHLSPARLWRHLRDAFRGVGLRWHRLFA